MLLVIFNRLVGGATPAAPTLTAPIYAGATSVGGTAQPGATVDVWVDGLQVATALADATTGAWAAAVLQPPAGASVTARQTVNGVTGPFCAAVVVSGQVVPPRLIRAAPVVVRRREDEEIKRRKRDVEAAAAWLMTLGW